MRKTIGWPLNGWCDDISTSVRQLTQRSLQRAFGRHVRGIVRLLIDTPRTVIVAPGEVDVNHITYICVRTTVIVAQLVTYRAIVLEEYRRSSMSSSRKRRNYSPKCAFHEQCPHKRFVGSTPPPINSTRVSVRAQKFELHLPTFENVRDISHNCTQCRWVYLMFYKYIHTHIYVLYFISSWSHRLLNHRIKEVSFERF